MASRITRELRAFCVGALVAIRHYRENMAARAITEDERRIACVVEEYTAMIQMVYEMIYDPDVTLEDILDLAPVCAELEQRIGSLIRSVNDKPITPSLTEILARTIYVRCTLGVVSREEDA